MLYVELRIAFGEPCPVKTLSQFITATALYLVVASVNANPIYYQVSNEGGDRWRYDYTVANNTLFEIEQFTIYFDYTLYDFALLPSAAFPGEFEVDANDYQGPPGWDVFVAPDADILGVEEDGFFDAFALGDLLEPGDVLGGFSVSFTYRGAGAPGRQFFEFFAYDAQGNDIFGESFTRPLLASPVPEPSPLSLCLLGLLLLVAGRKKTRTTQI